MLNRLNQVAASLNLPFGERKKTYNSRLAQELGLWAESKGKGHAFHMAAFHAYFAEGKNLAEKDVLLEISSKAGLREEEAALIIKDRSFSPQVDADWKLAGNSGITAVPTFIVSGSRLTGAQAYGDILRFIKGAAGGLEMRQ